MKDKKNIDKLFDEAFNNFEATPSPRVWENIQTELKKEKKDRKVIPLWIKYGGVAALLALLLTVGNWVFTPNDSAPNAITNEHSIDSVEKIDHNENNLKSKFPETQVATEQGNIQNSPTSDNNVATDNADKVKNGGKSVDRSANTGIVSRDYDNTSKSKENRHQGLNDGKFQNGNADNRTAVSKNTSDLPVNKDEKSDTHKKSKEVNEPYIKKDNVISEGAQEGIAITEKSENSKEKPVSTETTEDSKNKKSLLDAIAEKDEADKEAVRNESSKPERRWVVTPNVAPVYYSSLGNGSSIDPDFTNNPQKGDVNMSYGLQVSYALSERLSIRTGVNNMDLSYSTSDIIIGTGPVSAALQSVDYGGKQIVVTAISRSSLNGHSPSNGFGDITLKSTGGDARLIQNINYYEVPLELKYAVIDKKLGINLIGGVSTLFLGNNEISVKSDNFSSVLGAANNLSDISFSTNVGLGLDYKLSKSFVFNIEPMFKYQLNPYTDPSVNFKPYYLGVYSGLSFKF